MVLVCCGCVYCYNFGDECIGFFIGCLCKLWVYVVKECVYQLCVFVFFQEVQVFVDDWCVVGKWQYVYVGLVWCFMCGYDVVVQFQVDCFVNGFVIVDDVCVGGLDVSFGECVFGDVVGDGVGLVYQQLVVGNVI